MIEQIRSVVIVKKAFRNQQLAKFLVSNINSTKQAVAQEYNIDPLLEVPFLTAMQELFEFDNSVPWRTCFRFVGEATYQLLKLKRLKVEDLAKLLEAKEAKYLKRSLASYVFRASVSLVPPAKPLDLMFQDTNIRLEKTSPELNLMLPKQSQTYATQVDLEVTARCEWSAVEIAIHKLTLVKGVANLLVNAKKQRNEITDIGFIYGEDAVNQIRMSHGVILDAKKNRLLPTVSFPLQHGPQANSTFYIEKRLACEIYRHLKRLESVKDCIKSPLIESVTRYDRALDNSNLNLTLSGLWGSIEPICDSFSGEQMIGRMLKVLSRDEKSYHRLVLERCHTMRNSIAHTNSRMGDPEYHVYDLMRYVEHLIEFVFLNHGKFATFIEFVSFLDSSDSSQKMMELELTELEAKVNLLKQPSLLPENQKSLLISSNGNQLFKRR